MDESISDPVGGDVRGSIGKALARLPLTQFILTAAHEHRMRAVLVSWVQQVTFEPPMLMLAIDKTLAVGPFLHESRGFALNQIAETDRLLQRKFRYDTVIKQDGFETLDLVRKPRGSPVLTRAAAYFDCELVRHIDIEGDHDLYIGRILDAGVLNDGPSLIHPRRDGFEY